MNRRLLFAIIVVFLFAVGVIGWFFFFAQPNPTPSLGGTNNPLSLGSLPKQFKFIFNNNDQAPPSLSTTEVTFPKPEVLTKIWGRPSTGQTFVEKDIVQEISATGTQGTSTVVLKKLVHATSTILMFVDRTTGYIYSYSRDLGKIYQVSNTTIPGVYDAYIFDNGKRIVLRYADNEKNTIVGVLANIPQITEKEQPKPLDAMTYLPSQVTSVAVNKNKTLLSYLVTGDRGSSIYTITSKGATLVANTTFKEWSLFYGGDSLFATSKPSAYVEGQTVSIPSFESIVGGKTGLQSIPYSNNLLLNSMWSSDGLKTFISNGGNTSVLSITTLATKCAWGQKGFLVCAVPKMIPRTEEGLPDDWFQGRFFFEDTLVVVDANTSATYPLYSFDSIKEGPFDITSLSLSNSNAFISFIKKDDSSLWLVDTNLIGTN